MSIIDDCKLVRTLARFGIERETIADLTNRKLSTLRAFCEAEYLLGRAEYKRDLHSFQYEAAKAKNASVLIWLGKAILGQTDGPEKNADEAPRVFSPPVDPKPNT